MNDPAYDPKTAFPRLVEPAAYSAESVAERLHYLCGDWDEDWQDGDWLQLAEGVMKIIHARDAALLERLCQMVRGLGLSTGHADTPEELMAEVLDQVERLRGLLAGAMNALAGYGPGGNPLTPEDRERLSMGCRNILKTEGR